MQVYKNILVTMDCSSVDDAIVEHVSALAIQNKAVVYLLHVIHAHTRDQDRDLREKAEAALGTHCGALKDKGIDVRIIIRSGEPEEEIIKEIDENEYDLVAMAVHGHRFFADLLFGSVSDTLKHKANIPLLILGPGK